MLSKRQLGFKFSVLRDRQRATILQRALGYKIISNQNPQRFQLKVVILRWVYFTEFPNNSAIQISFAPNACFSTTIVRIFNLKAPKHPLHWSPEWRTCVKSKKS